MSFPVFLDTCVLYPATLNDTLLRIAERGAFQPHWSPDVLEELSRNLAKIPTVGRDGARRRIEAMGILFEDSLVVGYEALAPAMTCHPKDAHVLAAAVVSDCQVIVTYNLKDFPHESLAGHDLQVVHPDDFLLEQFDLYPRAVGAALAAQVVASARPALTPPALLDSLQRCGVPRFATEVRRQSGCQ